MLAVNGGKPVRSQPMPFREAFGDDEERAVIEAIRYYRANNIDPPYNGRFQKELCDSFCNYMGGGYTEAVSSGTSACFIALASLKLPSGSEVLISPVTDSGPLHAIEMLGLKPILMDSKKRSYNIDCRSVEAKINSNTSAIFVVHAAGEPVQMLDIVEIAKRCDVKIIEDCSQAPGALVCDKKYVSCIRNCNPERRVGNFGHVAAFSTMYRKTLTAGASSGLVYTRDYETYCEIVAYADRGRPKLKPGYDKSDPGDYLYPSLNFNTDELSSAIGISSLKRLEATIQQRVDFIHGLSLQIKENCFACSPYEFNFNMSPFYYPIFVDENKLLCDKKTFANAVKAEGIALAEHYSCIISGWEKAQKTHKLGSTPNAEWVRDNSFNLFINEKYQDDELRDIMTALCKVEEHFKKKSD